MQHQRWSHITAVRHSWFELCRESAIPHPFNQTATIFTQLIKSGPAKAEVAGEMILPLSLVSSIPLGYWLNNS